MENDERGAEFKELINDCNSGKKQCEGWKARIRGIKVDGRLLDILFPYRDESVLNFP